jgi:hypothetical protein
MRGTAEFIKQLEEVTGLKADCKPFDGTGVVRHKNADPEYTRWMNKYHNWDAEAMIGYVKRQPISGMDNVLPPPQDLDVTLEEIPSHAKRS